MAWPLTDGALNGDYDGSQRRRRDFEAAVRSPGALQEYVNAYRADPSSAGAKRAVWLELVDADGHLTAAARMHGVK